MREVDLKKQEESVVQDDFAITQGDSVGIAFSSGGVEAFLQALGFISCWRDHQLPDPMRIAASSGGVFAGMVMILGMEDDALDMMLDDAFQADAIYEPLPWRSLMTQGFQRYTFPETLRRYLGDLLDYTRQLDAIAKDDGPRLIAVTTPMRQSAGKVRGTNRRPFEEHFISGECTPEEILDAILASANMPSAYPYILRERPYTDGGFSRWYPLGVACRNVDVCIGLCYQIDVPRFADSAVLRELERWVSRGRYIPGMQNLLAEMRRRAERNHPPTLLDVFDRIIKMHTWRDMEIEETWATRQENQVKMLQQIAEATGAFDVVEAAMQEHAPHLAHIAPHKTIFTEASPANLNIRLRKNQHWTREEKQSVIDYGYDRTAEMLQEWGVIA